MAMVKAPAGACTLQARILQRRRLLRSEVHLGGVFDDVVLSLPSPR